MLFELMPLTKLRLSLAGAITVFASIGPARAQYADGLSASIEVASDERRRGLSWSDGDPVVRGRLSVPLYDGLSLDGATVALRGSDRHGGADAVIDIGPSYGRQIGAWRLTTEARYHLFPGASGQGYGEIGVGVGYLIGPASVDLLGSYAPQQSSIGGDNLYSRRRHPSACRAPP